MTGEKISAIVINEEDNVAVALFDIKQGEKISVRIKGKIREIIAKSNIPLVINWR